LESSLCYCALPSRRPRFNAHAIATESDADLASARCEIGGRLKSSPRSAGLSGEKTQGLHGSERIGIIVSFTIEKPERSAQGRHYFRAERMILRQLVEHSI
jgi:hypothetical protein